MGANNRLTELELRFQVPPAARAAVAAEMARSSSTLEHTSLAAMYLDTADRRLAQAGLAWRLRREGRRWIQTLKADGVNALERFEHEVVQPAARHNAARHAGTPAGERLIAILRRAEAEGQELGVCFRTEVRRTSRRVRTQGAVVEVAFDEGRLLAADSSRRIREIEFELVTGSAASLLALAERWRQRFGLIYEPRSKAERGDRLARGLPFPALRKAGAARYGGEAGSQSALAAVLHECLGQVTGNATGLIDGDPALRAEHLHQLRVAIRRLRSALRSFQDWTPEPPPHLVEGLRALFATLGQARDSDVLATGVVVELARVGAPPLSLPTGAAGPDPVAAVQAPEAQRLFLGWIGWQAELSQAHAGVPVRPQPVAQAGAGSAPSPALKTDAEDSAQPGPRQAEPDRPAAPEGAPAFHRLVDKRLRQWNKRILADWARFDELDESGMHALRKRIKRQRYAVEFFAPILRRRKAERYQAALADVQARMGELNDLFVARARYQSLVEADPAAWFALGWLAARIAECRADVKPCLARLAKVDPPTS